MIDAAGKSDIGKVRSTNQDAYHIGSFSPDAFWSVVCDGMGGANGGNVASLVAVGAISANMDRNYDPNKPNSSIHNLITTAVINANALVYQKSKQSPDLAGMGTTVVLTVIKDDMAYIAHVGDSRAYHINENTIRQITKDHTMVQYLIENGEITVEEAKDHPKKHLITRAVGVEETVSVDYNELEIQKGDKILVCSDGLSNLVNEYEILSVVSEHASLSDAVDTLISLANERGGNDNVTVVIMENC